jgi:signal transduction histidine kinase
MPEYLFTWPVFNATLIWALALHFSDLLNNVIGNYFQRFFIIIALHLAIFAVLYLLTKILFNLLAPHFVPIALFISIAILGTARGVVLQYFLIQFNSAVDSSYELRMWASFLNTTSSFVVATITLAYVRSQFSTRNRLLIDKDRLEYVQESAQISLASVSPEAVVGIKANLLQEIELMARSSTKEILLQIRNTIDEVVRPLSRSLDQKNSAWTPPGIEVKAFQINWIDAFKESTKPTQINYTLVPAMMCIVALPTILQRTSAVIALPALTVICTVGFIWGYLVQRFVAPNFKTSIAYFVLALINGALMGSLTLFFTSDYNEPYGLLILSIIFFPSSSLIISFLTTSIRLDKEGNQQLEEITKNLAWNVARVREQHFHMQKSLAAKLHGEVQAKLASTYLQIQNLTEAGLDNSDKIQGLLQDLRKTVEEIDRPKSSGSDLQAMLDRVKRNWDQVAKIQTLIDPKVLEQIERDRVCADTLAEIIPELCFNGIKHGNADHITISLKFKDERVVYLEVANNGLVHEINTPDGLGTKFLNEASISWERVQENGVTITKAEFAYSLEKALPY